LQRPGQFAVASKTTDPLVASAPRCEPMLPAGLLACRRFRVRWGSIGWWQRARCLQPGAPCAGRHRPGEPCCRAEGLLLRAPGARSS